MAELAIAAVSAISSASVPTILTAAGATIGAVGAIQSGNAARKTAEFQAQQYEQQAGQQRAVAQRQSIEERRQAGLLASKLQARAGGGGTDPTTLGLAGDIAGEGEYAALTSLYEGNERAIGNELRGASARVEGKQAQTASRYKAASTILQGASGFSKYWN